MSPIADDGGPTRRVRHRANGTLEREIIACLGAEADPLTPAQVHAALGGELAYSTITTVLSRLHAKQAVVRVPLGRGFAYRLAEDSAGAQASVTAHRMRMLLDSEADRAGVLSRFIETLGEDTERLLRQLLDDADRGESAGPGSGSDDAPGARR